MQLQFFQYGTVFLFIVSLFDKPKRLFQDKYFGILTVFCFLSVFFHPVSIKIFPNVFLGLLLYYLVVSYTKNVKSVLKVVVVVAGLNTIFALLQFFDIHLIYRPTVEIIGLMSYKSHLGIYQAIAVPICYAFNPWLSIIPIIGLLLSKSITAIIPAIIGMGYLLRNKIYHLRSMPILMMIISCFVFLGGKIFYKFSLRFDVWLKTLVLISQKFVYGYGIGVFKYVSSKGIIYQDPYNLYLGIAHALGIFGLIVFLVFIFDKFEVLNNNNLMVRGVIASCLIFLVSGFGYSFMNYPRLAGTAVVLFGLLTVIKKEESCLLNT